MILAFLVINIQSKHLICRETHVATCMQRPLLFLAQLNDLVTAAAGEAGCCARGFVPPYLRCHHHESFDLAAEVAHKGVDARFQPTRS